ncbi:TRAP transporter large permease [Bacillus sp. B15-48]|uniref:TRAP transporter large permease n=1 Tax=Bacillus sp. B15-48 TaxID=1548601 RepID=UPI00193FC913|nr:TRAP transporter large permease [Bacillus sp. B15-48]MBM4763651.1 TRAP transporter large permease subunit [Bacillus sp. B15-48]
MGIAFTGFVALIAVGVPIAIVLGLTALIFVFATGSFEILNSLPSRMFSGTQNFGLLAIPLFMLVGELMNFGGVTGRLIKFANSIIGHVRGGLAYVNVAANTFLASIMGSAQAQSAVMSRVMVPEMEKSGYNREYSTALTGASSIVGPLIPPSMPFIIYGVTAQVSIGGLFMAGIIPGILFTFGFAILIAFLGKKYNYPKAEKSQFSEIMKNSLSVLPGLLIPFIIVVGILAGIFTPTESAAVAALIAFIVGAFFYRELKLKDLPQIFLNTARSAAIVTFLVATANIFGWVLTIENIPTIIAEGITSLTSNPLVFLLLINVLFLLVGMVMEGIAAMIILVPILLPLAITYGVDPLHFGVIIVINLTIGLLTPPVGTVLFITSAIANVKLEGLIRAILPFLVISIAILLVITYVPWVSTFIPRVAGL